MKSSQVMHSFVCYPPDHIYSEDNAICSRSDGAKRRFQIYLITTLCSLCNIFTSMPSTAVYQQKSKVNIFFFFFLMVLYSSPFFYFFSFCLCDSDSCISGGCVSLLFQTSVWFSFLFSSCV